MKYVFMIKYLCLWQQMLDLIKLYQLLLCLVSDRFFFCVTLLSGFARGNMIDCLTWSRHSFTPMQFIQRGLSGLLETNGRLWLDYLQSFAVNYSVANLEASATEWLFFLFLFGHRWQKSNVPSLCDEHNLPCFTHLSLLLHLYWYLNTCK